MPDDVRFNTLAAESVREGVRDVGIGAKGSPEGVDAADLRSSAAFLLPPNMLKGRNQPEGAGLVDAAAALGVAAVGPLAEDVSPASMHNKIMELSTQSIRSSQEARQLCRTTGLRLGLQLLLCALPCSRPTDD